MSYFADHLAWQQRVAQEFKASSQFTEQNQSEKSGTEYFRYPDLVNYLLKSTNGSEAGTPLPMGDTQNANISNGMHGAFNTNGSHYDYKPKTNFLIRSKSSAGSARRSIRSFGTVSQAGSVVQKQPSVAASIYSKTQKRSIFNPSNAPSAVGVKRRERFNESMDSKSVRSLAKSTRSLTSANLMSKQQSVNGSQKEGKSVTYVSTASKFNMQRYSISGSQTSKHTDVSRMRRKALHTKNIMEVVNKLDEHELEKVSELLRQSEKEQAEANDDFEQEEVAEHEGIAEDFPEGEEEQVADAEEEDEVVSLPDAIQFSRQTGGSRGSSRAAIASLQNQLNEERDERLKLERTLQDLKLNSLEMVNQMKQ